MFSIQPNTVETNCSNTQQALELISMLKVPPNANSQGRIIYVALSDVSLEHLGVECALSFSHHFQYLLNPGTEKSSFLAGDIHIGVLCLC